MICDILSVGFSCFSCTDVILRVVFPYYLGSVAGIFGCMLLVIGFTPRVFANYLKM